MAGYDTALSARSPTLRGPASEPSSLSNASVLPCRGWFQSVLLSPDGATSLVLADGCVTGYAQPSLDVLFTTTVCPPSMLGVMAISPKNGLLYVACSTPSVLLPSSSSSPSFPSSLIVAVDPMSGHIVHSTERTLPAGRRVVAGGLVIAADGTVFTRSGTNARIVPTPPELVPNLRMAFSPSLELLANDTATFAIANFGPSISSTSNGGEDALYYAWNNYEGNVSIVERLSRSTSSSSPSPFKRVWSFRLPQGGPEMAPASTPALNADGTTVFVSDDEGNVMALDAATGAMRWRTNVGCASSLYAVSSMLLVAFGNAGMCSSIVGVAPGSGAILWSTSVPDNNWIVAGYPLVVDADYRAFIGTNYGGYIVIDLTNNGRRLYARPSRMATTWPFVVGNGRVLLLEADGRGFYFRLEA